MPFTINGFGTALSGYGAPVAWTKPQMRFFGQQPDHDAVECFVALYFPVVPLRAVHTFDWNGSNYRMIPIRMTSSLVVQTYVRPIALLLAGCGWIGAVITLAWAIFGRDLQALPWLGASIALLAVGHGLLFFLLSRDQRTRDVRLIIGRHGGGTSDPALWKGELLASFAQPNLGEARAAIQRNEFPGAMMAARIAIATGNAEGELLTEEILAHPRIQSVLPELRREPWRRAEILGRIFSGQVSQSSAQAIVAR